VFKPAACVVLIDKDNAVLLTRRADRIFFSRAWVCPGGHVDPNESLEDAALRELQEECGVKIMDRNFMGRAIDIKPICIFESTTPPRQPEVS
jgi:8-oxo-dGTP pyrophosphatase MutT (NUDIX family)